MTVTSFSFFLFLLAGVILYYFLPGKMQWIALLAMSVVFYILATKPYSILFLLFSTFVAYSSTLYITQNRGKENKIKTVTIVAIISVILNIIIWFLLKGSSFWEDGSLLIAKIIPSFPILGPLPFAGALGMGYYTAQVIGYILDVLWGNAEAQRDPIKLFLFICFFPQLTVGPISRYNDLKILFHTHKFSYSNLCLGTQRIVWGLFKKLVIADRLAIIVNAIWADTDVFFGVWPWIAVFIYPLQLYTDFSGCMDIVLGAAELFDIHLAENFKNPFFSRNSQEFWRRWHITLGSWARDYVFYPFMKSRWMIRFGKKCKNRFGKRWGKFIPWSISMAVLWFVMGFWHGSVRHIFGVSLWFWTALFLSELCLPVTNKITHILEVEVESFSWHLFQSLRTYFVYALGVIFFSATSLNGALKHYSILLSSLSELNRWSIAKSIFLQLGVKNQDIFILILGLSTLLIVDILREKKTYARWWMSKQCVGFRWMVWLYLFFSVILFGVYGGGYSASTFIYQGF